MIYPPTFTKAHCNACGGERNHVVLHQVVEKWGKDGDQYQGTDTYETLQCAGCNAIKLRHCATYPSEPYESTTYFPAAVFRRHPQWFPDLIFDMTIGEDAVTDLLNEIYVSLQHNMLRVAAMGVRALLETVMIAKTGDKGNFSENVTAFEKLGYIASIEKERLLTILEAGHAAIHRSYKPSREDVITLVDITEHIIESVYVHEPKIKKLQNRIPKRSPKAK
jgi:Domain of unknown function (DUF4145)